MISGLLERLATPLLPEAYLATFAPLSGARPRGIVEQTSPLTDSAVAIRLRTGSNWTPHRAGQFVTIGVDVDGVRHHRCYSITTAPGPPGSTIEIAVQATPGGLVSTHLARHARVGDVFQLEQAAGEFCLPDASSGPLLFVTGGSGITPVIAMLRTLDGRHRRGHDIPSVRLLHHSPDADRVMFRDELRDLAARHDWLDLDVEHTRAAVPGSVRLSSRRLETLCPDWRDRHAYVCGPDALVEFAVEHWDAAGLAERLRIERFALGPSVVRRTPTTESNRGSNASRVSFSRVSFSDAGIDVDAEDDVALLEVAERAGLTPVSGCRMGICRTCSTQLESGCVRDLRDGRLVEPGGHVQICITAAATDVTLAL